MYNVSVFEDVVSGIGVLQVLVRDDDIGNNVVVNYYIVVGNVRVVFEINKDFGQIVVVSFLDCEIQDFYKFKIRVQDGKNFGIVVVNIYVKDVNDNNFVFFNYIYVVYVYENWFVGSIVVILLVVDKDLG